MALVDNKRNVHSTIGAYTSLKEEGELPNPFNKLPSINNSREILPFLLDLLKVVVGSNALMSLTGRFFSDFINVVEPQIKIAYKKQLLQYNASDMISGTGFSTGYRVPVKNIDLFGKLKNDPSSNIGSLLYGDNVNSFDMKAYEAIVNEGTEVQYGNLLIEYDSITDEFIFKPTNTNVTVGDWMNDIIDNTTFINRKEMISNVMDGMFGTLTTNQNKSADEIFNEQLIERKLEHAVDGDLSFEISDDERNELLKRANELKNGVLTYDMGCGILETKLAFDEMDDTVNNILNTESSMDIGNILDDTINESANGNEDIIVENKETIRDNFFLRLIKRIRLFLIKTILVTPQARAVNAISSALSNNDEVLISTTSEDFSRFKTFIKCIIEALKEVFYEFIYRLIVVALVQLLRPIVRKLIREKINQYLRVLKSLIRR